MTLVVSEAYIRCKCTDRVDVCLVDAFRERPNVLAIDRSKVEAKLGELKR